MSFFCLKNGTFEFLDVPIYDKLNIILSNVGTLFMTVCASDIALFFILVVPFSSFVKQLYKSAQFCISSVSMSLS